MDPLLEAFCNVLYLVWSVIRTVLARTFGFPGRPVLLQPVFRWNSLNDSCAGSSCLRRVHVFDTGDVKFVQAWLPKQPAKMILLKVAERLFHFPSLRAAPLVKPQAGGACAAGLCKANANFAWREKRSKCFISGCSNFHYKSGSGRFRIANSDTLDQLNIQLGDFEVTRVWGLVFKKSVVILVLQIFQGGECRGVLLLQLESHRMQVKGFVELDFPVAFPALIRQGLVLVWERTPAVDTARFNGFGASFLEIPDAIDGFYGPEPWRFVFSEHYFEQSAVLQAVPLYAHINKLVVIEGIANVNSLSQIWYDDKLLDVACLDSTVCFTFENSGQAILFELEAGFQAEPFF